MRPSASLPVFSLRDRFCAKSLNHSAPAILTIRSLTFASGWSLFSPSEAVASMIRPYMPRYGLGKVLSLAYRSARVLILPLDRPNERDAEALDISTPCRWNPLDFADGRVSGSRTTVLS